jgi:peptidoglycan/xylan/chitin deacetylase (PgdA/CDA1 family)
VVVSALAALIAVAGAIIFATPSGAAVTKPTIVSLTFDDSNADQVAAEQTMKANGLVGTFYTVDEWIGSPDYLSRTDLSNFNADGNEIAGHTASHPDLIQIDPAEAQRQICNDRATLQSWGYQPVDFAYPFADANSTVENLAKSCGYNTARGLGDIRSPASCGNCVYAETMPPPDPYYLRAADQVDSTWTLAQMKAEVTNAVNHGGGWVTLTFHHICASIGAADCQADQSTTPTIYNAFISWLASYSRTAANKTSVKTVDQVVRQYLGTNYPAYKNATPVAPRPPAAVGVNALTNPSLETTDSFTGFPTCFQPGGWGTNTAAWAASSPGHTGNAAQLLTVSGYADGDAKLLPNLDLGTCSPTVVPGKKYNLSVWYQATGTTQFALYYRDAQGVWYYWTSSPWFATASSWTQATFTTPPVPANAVGMSFGFALIANGTLLTDDYSLVDPGTTGSAAAAHAATVSPSKASPAKSRPSRHNRTFSHKWLRIPGGHGVRSGTKIVIPEWGHVGKG